MKYTQHKDLQDCISMAKYINRMLNKKDDEGYIVGQPDALSFDVVINKYNNRTDIYEQITMPEKATEAWLKLKLIADALEDLGLMYKRRIETLKDAITEHSKHLDWVQERALEL